MSNVTDIKVAKSARKRKRIIQNIVSVVAVIAVMAIAVNIDSIVGYLDIGYHFTEWYSPGDGFPVEVESGHIKSTVEYDGKIGVLTDSGFSVYSPTGREISHFYHSYASPYIAIEGDAFVLYDLGGTKLSLYINDELIQEYTVDNPIIDVDVSSDGNVAVVSSGSGFLTQVAVYDKVGSEIYRWQAVESCITDVAIDSSTMIVSALSIEDSYATTTISYFSFSSDTAIFQDEIQEEMPISADYTSTGIVLCTDGGIYKYDFDGNLTASYIFGNKALGGFTMDEFGNIAVGFSTKSEKRIDYITVLDTTLNESFSMELDDELNDFTVEDGNMYLLLEDYLVCYSLLGSEQWSTELTSGEGITLVVVGDYYYISTTSDIYQY